MPLLELGQVYRIKQYFWLLFPSKECAAAATAGSYGAAVSPRAATRAANWSNYWSKELGCVVSWIPEGEVITVLSADFKQTSVLDSNGRVGWINCDFECWPWMAECFEKVSE